MIRNMNTFCKNKVVFSVLTCLVLMFAIVAPFSVLTAQGTSSTDPTPLTIPKPSTGVNGTYSLYPGKMPCIGSPKIVVFVVDFLNDTPGGWENYSVADIEERLFAEVNTNSPGNYADESLRSYFYRSSYGQLDITGEVIAYTTQYTKDAYTSALQILNEAMENAGTENDLDWSKYDTNNDGTIDGVYLILRNHAPFNQDAYVTGGNDFTRAGKITRGFVFVPGQGFNNLLYALSHETTHLMGPPDIYAGVGLNPAGTGALTIMEGVSGSDLPGVIKCIFGWIEPTIIAKVGETQVTLASMSDEPELAIIYANANINSYDWFVVEYLTSTNNNAVLSNVGLQSDGGLRIWRVKMASGFLTNGTEFYKSPSGVGYAGFSPYSYIETVHQSVYPYLANRFFYSGDTFTPSTALNSSYPQNIVLSGSNALPTNLTDSGVFLHDIYIQGGVASFKVTISWLFVDPNGGLQSMVQDNLQLLGQSGPNWDYSPVTKMRIAGAMMSTMWQADFMFIQNSLGSYLQELDVSGVTSTWPANAFYNCTALTHVRVPANVTLGAFMFNMCGNLTTLQVGDAAYKENVIDLSGYTVGSYGGAGTFERCYAITHVRVPANVALPIQMFMYCMNLTTLQVGEAAFVEGMIDLKDYTAPSYGNNAFLICSSISKVRLPGNVDLSTSMFNGASNLSELHFIGGTTAPINNGNALGNIKSTGTVYYPSGATGYNSSSLGLPSGWLFVVTAFNGSFSSPNGNLQSMVHDNLRLLGQSGSSWDYSPVTKMSITGTMAAADFTFIKNSLGPYLQELDVSSVTSPWPNSAFQDCIALTHVRIPANTELGSFMFNRCQNLTTLQVGNAAYEENVVDLSGYTAVSYGVSPFGACSAVTHVRIPAGVELSLQMFTGCTSLTTLQVGSAAFVEGVIDLKDYTAGSYGANAFLVCSAVSKVRLYSGIAE